MPLSAFKQLRMRSNCPIINVTNKLPLNDHKGYTDCTYLYVLNVLTIEFSSPEYRIFIITN